jgi:hypothetical protein
MKQRKSVVSMMKKKEGLESKNGLPRINMKRGRSVNVRTVSKRQFDDYLKSVREKIENKDNEEVERKVWK